MDKIKMPKMTKAGLGVLVLALLCLGTVSVPHAAAAPSRAGQLKALRADVKAVAAKVQHHKKPTAKSLKTIKTLTGKVKPTVKHTRKCNSALTEAGRLYGERKHPAKVKRDAIAAAKTIGACQLTPAKTSSSGKVGGSVLNSQGKALAHKTITVTYEDSINDVGKQWTVRTDAHGRFVVPWALSNAKTWFTWTADYNTTFYGNYQSLHLKPLSSSNAAKLKFQVTLAGPEVMFRDPDQCFVMWADPEYPCSNPTAVNFTFKFTPVRMIDGTAAKGTTLTLAQSYLVDGGVNIPDGKWKIWGASDSRGRQLIFSTDGTHYSTTAWVTPNSQYAQTVVYVLYKNPPTS